MHSHKKNQTPDAHQQAAVIAHFVRVVSQQIALPTHTELQAIWPGLRNFIQLSVDACAQATSVNQET